MFACSGVALIWCARDVRRKRVYINPLAAVFFVGGIGRLVGVAIDGAPVLPPLMVVVAKRVTEPISV